MIYDTQVIDDIARGFVEIDADKLIKMAAKQQKTPTAPKPQLTHVPQQQPACALDPRALAAQMLNPTTTTQNRVPTG
jgi:hypothetical protein